MAVTYEESTFFIFARCESLKSGFWQLISRWSSGLVTWLVIICLGFESYSCLIFLNRLFKTFSNSKKKSVKKQFRKQNWQMHRSPKMRSPEGIGWMSISSAAYNNCMLYLPETKRNERNSKIGNKNDQVYVTQKIHLCRYIL